MPRNWKDIEGHTKEKYDLYLCSREWSVLRRKVHDRAGGFCERCRVNPIDAVHHLTYARRYEERLEDLQAICTPCHEFTHGHSDEDPADDEDCTSIDVGIVHSVFGGHERMHAGGTVELSADTINESILIAIRSGPSREDSKWIDCIFEMDSEQAIELSSWIIRKFEKK